MEWKILKHKSPISYEKILVLDKENIIFTAFFDEKKNKCEIVNFPLTETNLIYWTRFPDFFENLI
jgi:hypothetical protein